MTDTQFKQFLDEYESLFKKYKIHISATILFDANSMFSAWFASTPENNKTATKLANDIAELVNSPLPPENYWVITGNTDEPWGITLTDIPNYTL